jgi:hypothetical protein
MLMFLRYSFTVFFLFFCRRGKDPTSSGKELGPCHPLLSNRALTTDKRLPSPHKCS